MITQRPGTEYVCTVRIPEGKTLIPFQQEGVLKLVARKHNLLADEMGLGKTIQAIVLINSLQLHRILIVCKASIKRNWKNKLEEWLTSARVIQIIDKKTEFISDLTEVVIINYDLISHSYMHQQLTSIEWDLIICDEAHNIKNMNAQRTKAVLAKGGLVHHAKRTLMMTGTPILNRPIELYPILKVLAPLVIAPYSDYWRYAKRYCDAFEDGFTLNVKGASNIEELNKKLRQHYMIRRLTKEVEVELPKKRYEMVFIDSTKEIQDRLKILADPTRKDFKYYTGGIGAAELATLRRETAEQKVNTHLATIKEYVESTDKIVIFAYHRSIIETLTKELESYGVVQLHGGCSQNARSNAIRDFQNNSKTKVFIGQIDAAGEGVDGLQEVCNNALFVEWSWVPGAIEQACKRLHRIGQRKPVLLRFLVWADSIEEHMMRVALDKVKIIKEILK